MWRESQLLHRLAWLLGPEREITLAEAEGRGLVELAYLAVE